MRFFYVIIVPLIWEEVNVLPSPALMMKNDIQIGFATQKHPKTPDRREMSNGNRQVADLAENLDSLLVAIDTGNVDMPDAIGRANKREMIDKFIKNIGEFVKYNIESPMYRSKVKEYDIRPEIIQMRGEKPSLMLNLNSETIVNGLKDILTSKLANRMIEKLSKDSGSIFPVADE